MRTGGIATVSAFAWGQTTGTTGILPVLPQTRRRIQNTMKSLRTPAKMYGSHSCHGEFPNISDYMSIFRFLSLNVISPSKFSTLHIDIEHEINM
jgi:hypothetical protein